MLIHSMLITRGDCIGIHDSDVTRRVAVLLALPGCRDATEYMVGGASDRSTWTIETMPSTHRPLFQTSVGQGLGLCHSYRRDHPVALVKIGWLGGKKLE